jgi:predicted nucleic acid-binding protein
VPLVYLDASALLKLLAAEPESEALGMYLRGASLVSCELLLVEVPRAVRRAAGRDARVPLGDLLARASVTLEAVALVPLHRALLVAAGAIPEPSLRALDAIHVAAAVDVAPLDAFVTYDERQAAAARLAGLRTVAPGG